MMLQSQRLFNGISMQPKTNVFCFIVNPRIMVNSIQITERRRSCRIRLAIFSMESGIG